MKETALSGRHRSLGARMIPFAGFIMPVEYTSVRDEHITVRQKAGVFDVSHMGEIHIRGPEAARFLQYVTSNDVNKLRDGRIQYTCLPNGHGGIVDDLLAYRFSPTHFMVVPNAANVEKDWQWLNENNRFDATLEDASEQTGQLAVQGPLATEILQACTQLDLGAMKYFTFTREVFAGIRDVVISATGYTGAGGFELYFPVEHSLQMWEAVIDAGKGSGLKPVGLAARDTLRLEMGFCLYGNDIDDQTSPLEAGLDWITKFTEGNDFIDRQRLEKQKETGVSRKLVGFRLLDRGIPRQHYQILDKAGNRIGQVTSGTMSPMMHQGIGMGYLTVEHATPGTPIGIQIRRKTVPAEVVSFPIYRQKKKGE